MKIAQIILIDKTNEVAVQFASEWPGKLVLHFLWVYACIERGRIIGESEEWGGCRVGAGPFESLWAETKSVINFIQLR